MKTDQQRSSAVWINFLLFQSVYTLSLVGVINGLSWLGCVALGAFALWHACTATTAKSDFVIAGIAMFAGFLLDTLYIRSGLITYSGSMLWSGVAPVWIVALWANFALTFNGCLRWLRSRLWLAATLACIGSPLSYYAGIRLGTATITGDATLLFGLIALTWGITVPALLWLSSQVERQMQSRHSVLLPAI